MSDNVYFEMMRYMVISLLIAVFNLPVTSVSWAATTVPDAPSNLLVSTSASPIELLTGPLTPLRSPETLPLVDDYNDIQLTQGKVYAEGFPAAPSCILCSNYYDLALALYQIYYRTDDPYWLEKARTVGRAWRDSENIFALKKVVLESDWSYGPSMPPPRSMSTLGLAILAVEANDAEAREAVRVMALWAKNSLPGNLGGIRLLWGDPRESGYMLMALVAATALGDDYKVAARELLDDILAKQQPSGQWHGYSGLVTDSDGKEIPFTLNYMQGLLTEALVFYDRVIGDPRILPALVKAVDWTWTTQWVASAQAFQYADITAGSVNTNPYVNLSGLILPVWGYVYYKTGNAVYLDQGNQILKGMVEIGGNEIWGVKQFAQMFRSSSRYLGYVGLR